MERLRLRRDFETLARARHRGRGDGVVIRWSPTHGGDGEVVVGFAVGRRCGGAVVRNRLRRRLRDIMRSTEKDLQPGLYLVQATPDAAAMAFTDLERAVHRGLGAAGARREDR